jgi:hypothetical protein
MVDGVILELRSAGNNSHLAPLTWSTSNPPHRLGLDGAEEATTELLTCGLKGRGEPAEALADLCAGPGCKAKGQSRFRGGFDKAG